MPTVVNAPFTKAPRSTGPENASSFTETYEFDPCIFHVTSRVVEIWFPKAKAPHAMPELKITTPDE